MGNVVNYEISLTDVKNFEQMVRRFTKKVSKLGILDEYIEKSRYKKPSELRNEKKRKLKREKLKKRRKGSK